MANEVKLKLAVTGASAVRQDIDSVNAKIGDLGQASLTAAKAMAGAFAGISVGQTIGKLIAVQREFDVLNSSLITVTGSSAAAAREMAWIKTFAKDTPFGLAQATQGFVKMKALGLDPTIGSLTSFGNTASAMGKDLNQMVEAVADAATGEFERLKDFGITARKQGDEVKLTFQGVTTTIGNNAKEITGYLEAIGNNQFARAMVERAKTLDGAIAALGDTWDDLFRTVSTNNAGSLIYDGVTLATKAIEDATTVLNSMTSAAQTNARETGAMSTVQGALATVFETVAVLGVNVKHVLTGIGTELGGLAAQAVQILQGNFSGAAAIRREMVADAAAARREVDATTAAILMAREHAKTAGAINAQANARLARQSADAIASVTAATQTHTTATKAQESAAKAAAKAQEELTKAYTAQAQTLADARNKEYDEIEKYMAAQRLKSLEDANAAEAAVRAAQEELDNHGKLRSAIAETTAAKMEQRLLNLTAGTEEYNNLQRQIKAQRELAGIYRQGEVRDAADDLRKENKKAAEASEKYWEDALMRAFESGKGFFESLWDTIKNTLKTQVLKVTVQASIGTVGALGEAGTAIAGGTGPLGVASDALSLASNGKFLATAGSAFTGAFSAGATIGMEAFSAGATMMAEATGVSSFMAGAGQTLGAIGPVGWAALAAGAVFSMKSDKVDSYSLGGTRSTYSATGDRTMYDPYYNTPNGTTPWADKIVQGLQDTYTGLAKSLGATLTETTFQFAANSGKNAASPNFFMGGSAGGSTFYQGETKITEEAMALASSRAVFAALQGSELPKHLVGVFDGITASTATQEQINTALAGAQALSAFNAALTAMPAHFQKLADLGYELTLSLAASAGGLDVLGANLGTYYAAFYSDEEQRAQTIKSINAATVGSGLDAATATREQFRQIVEAQDLTTESGRNTYAALLSVSGVFATVADSTDKVRQAFVDTVADVGKSLTDLLGSIATERAAVASARAGITGTPAMSYTQISRAIAAASLDKPSTTALDRADAALTTAQANYDLRVSQKAANTTRVDVAFAAKQAAVAAVTAEKSVSTEAVDLVATYLRFGNLNSAGVGGPASLTSLATYNDSQSNMELKLASKPMADILSFAKTLSTLSLSGGDYSGAAFAQQAAEYKAAIAAQAAAGPVIEGAVADAQREYDLARGQITPTATRLATATTALAAANTAVETAAANYVQALATYAGDTEKAVTTLGNLREETVKYYETQKALADLMLTSAANLRTAIKDARLLTLTDSQGLQQRLAQFGSDYSLALATTGEVKAGYADKLAAALPQLATDLASTSATRLDWSVAVAKLTSQSATIASQLEAGAPQDYETKAITLLDAIDGKLATMSSSTASLQTAITTAVDNGSLKTAAGLVNLIKAVQGDTSTGLQAFALGGAFAGGQLVSTPTVAPMALFGEAGPEAIMPLTRGPGGALGVRGYGGGADPDAERRHQELVAQMRAMNERLQAIEREAEALRRENNIGNSQIVAQATKTARLAEKWDVLGLPPEATPAVAVPA